MGRKCKFLNDNPIKRFIFGVRNPKTSFYLKSKLDFTPKLGRFLKRIGIYPLYRPLNEPTVKIPKFFLAISFEAHTCVGVLNQLQMLILTLSLNILLYLGLY